MKKICFIELEGILASYLTYSPEQKRVNAFVKRFSEYCKKQKIDLYLVSGHHEPVAKEKMSNLKFESYFDDAHFLFVNSDYISKKSEVDKKLHEDGLSKDANYVDSYFLQVAIQKILAEKNASPSEALLLGNDVWVDGYYTTRFSKIDFALFEENLLDRGKSVQPISGLIYFKLDFEQVKKLITDFPKQNLGGLDKYVFETMKKALVGDNFADAIKKGLVKRMQNN